VSDVFSPSSKERLTDYDLGRFPNETLLDRVGRAVCNAGCLPRKELFEAWEVARRVRRRFRGGRVIDMAAGHGLLAHLMLLLDDSSPSAVAIDATLPASSSKLHDALLESWPRLAGRITFVADDLHSLPLNSTDVVVSSHACGALTDVILDCAMDTGARVAVLPCCHDVDTCDTGGLTGWVDAPLAIDLMRAARLERRGYRVWTQSIPADITPKNRLLMGSMRGDDLRVSF
jgi:Methyltransferase domain